MAAPHWHQGLHTKRRGMRPGFHPGKTATTPTVAQHGHLALLLVSLLACGCEGPSGGGYEPPPNPQGEEGLGGPSPLEVPGTTYYVNATSGHDHNHGLSAANALLTLRAGVAKLSPDGGDRLILQGTFQESLSIADINNPAGSAPDPTLPTVIQCDFDAAGNPLAAAIDGGISGASSFPFDKQGLPPGFGPGTGNYLWFGINITDCNYLTLSGFEVRGIAGMGINGFGASQLSVEHMTVQWTTGSAMFFNVSPAEPAVADLTVAHCRVNQSNLGAWQNQATQQNFNFTTETISIVKYDGFSVFRNHISNSMMVGIDFKEGAKNGSIRNNLIENLRSIGIYANEGDDTLIFRNVVRQIGYYDPEDGTGLQLAAPYLSQKLPFTIPADGASGIVLSNGDLGAVHETGRCSGNRVYENIVGWTLKNGINVNNEWRNEGKTGWEMDDNHLYNNVVFRSAQQSGAGGLVLDVGMTNSTITNNIIDHSKQYGVFIFGSGNFFASNVISNNLYHLNANYGVLGLNPQLGDPRFFERPPIVGLGFDFRVEPGSPAIGTGVGSSGAVDIGAYQRNQTTWAVGPRSGT